MLVWRPVVGPLPMREPVHTWDDHDPSVNYGAIIEPVRCDIGIDGHYRFLMFM